MHGELSVWDGVGVSGDLPRCGDRSMSKVKRAYTRREGSKRPGRPSVEGQTVTRSIRLSESEVARDTAMAAALGISFNELHKRMRRKFYALLNVDESDDNLDSAS